MSRMVANHQGVRVGRLNSATGDRVAHIDTAKSPELIDCSIELVSPNPELIDSYIELVH